MFGPSDFLDSYYASDEGTKVDELGREVCSKGKSNAGVAIRALDEILTYARDCDNKDSSDVSVKVTMQYVEIYNNKINDLLTGRAVDLRDRGSREGAFQFVMSNATEVKVESLEDAIDVLKVGDKRKKREATAMNDRSSR
jgi:hypothetical protein